MFEHENRTVSASSVTLEQQQVPLQRALEHLVRNNIVPGIGAVVTLGGQTISAFAGYSATASCKPITENTGFETSCLMKFYVSLVALKLVEAGAINIDAPIGTYLPDLERIAPSKANNIHVRHLMSHTSGYRGTNVMDASTKWNYNWQRFLEFLSQTEELFSPGTVFNYENSEHVLLGAILERVTGQQVTDLVGDLICAADGSDRKRWAETKRDEQAVGYIKTKAGQFSRALVQPMGSFWRASLFSKSITLNEIAAVGGAILRGPSDLVARDTYERMQLPQITLPPMALVDGGEILPESFGILCGQYRNGLVGHNASTLGQACAFRIMPSIGAFIAVGMNCWLPHVRDRLIEWIADALVDRTADLNIKHELKESEIFDAFKMEQLAGVYIGGNYGQVEIVVTQKCLRALVELSNGPSELFEVHRVEPEVVRVVADTSRRIGFFPSPDDGTPCLAFCSNVYKRVS